MKTSPRNGTRPGQGRLMMLHVWVEDDEGRPIEECGSHEIEIYEDEEPREIAMFAERRRDSAYPCSIVVAVDVSRSDSVEVSATKEALLAFVRSLPPEAEVAILGFAERIRLLSSFETSSRPLAVAIERLDRESVSQTDGESTESPGPALYDSLFLALSMLEARANRTQILLLVSDGDDGGSRTSLRAIENRIAASPALVFAAGQASGESERPPIRETSVRGRWELARLAAMSGGFASFGSHADELGHLVARVAETLHHHYVIGYYAFADAESPRYRRIELRFKRDRSSSAALVRSRAGYLR